MACCGRSKAVTSIRSKSSYTLPLPKNTSSLSASTASRSRVKVCPICGQVEQKVTKKVRGKVTTLIKCGCPHLKRFPN